MVRRTYQYRIYPSKNAEKQFESVANTVQALYNMMLRDRTEHYRKTRTWKKLNPAPFIAGSLLMKDLEPSVVAMTVNKLENAYEQFHNMRRTKTDRYRQEAIDRADENPEYVLMETDLIGYPKIKTKTTSESINIGSAGLQVRPYHLNVPGIGTFKIRIHRPIPMNCQIEYYTLLKKASGHFFLQVHLLIPETKQKESADLIMGLAYEPGGLVRFSDGTPAYFVHEDPGLSAKIRLEYEKLSRMTPGSNRYEKQRKYLASLYEKRVNQRRDNLHKLANMTVDTADYIALEEPRVMRKKKKLLSSGEYRRVQDEAWWTFSSYIRYKCQDHGKWLWIAPRGIPAQKACSCCGVIGEESPRGRYWECDYCGVKMPAALNTARNLMMIAEEAKRKNSETLDRQGL